MTPACQRSCSAAMAPPSAARPAPASGSAPAIGASAGHDASRLLLCLLRVLGLLVMKSVMVGSPSRARGHGRQKRGARTPAPPSVGTGASAAGRLVGRVWAAETAGA